MEKEMEILISFINEMVLPNITEHEVESAPKFPIPRQVIESVRSLDMVSGQVDFALALSSQPLYATLNMVTGIIDWQWERLSEAERRSLRLSSLVIDAYYPYICPAYLEAKAWT